MQALHATLVQRACRLWVRWQTKLCILVSLTTPPPGCSEEVDRNNCTKWRNMVKESLVEWEGMTQRVTIVGEGGDDEDNNGDDDDDDVPESHHDEQGDDDATEADGNINQDEDMQDLD
ncbi:uncharacterized protein MELLADRAFT_66983 [Melampsora larici-populina 98AG31]|uniref:Secreted protein n=1 Tax=Melampsora larici-populina (strain 98AG31 / pathotype 3-4-7) TaxID=747676 RepID=F4S1D0_MELLP|nr:uncharacterized protein MELLADRAFT_66983 [Melampsora larici-populina 98AG31]EGG01540.1 hypothetical protein MELLADRAFT_66983 [Melampsora larici-populina 98AG31]